MQWLESIAGQTYATAMMWTLGALLLLLVILLLIKIVRNLTFGTFVSGGRNRKARLAVMDAAAVDSHRRLVLVRRDDVEHLILIGGQTDIVVEQNIRLAPAARRPGDEPVREHPAEERPRAAPTVVPHPSAAPRAAPEPAAPPPATPAQPAQPRITPVARPATPVPAAQPRPVPPPSTLNVPPRPPVTPMPRPSAPVVTAAPPAAAAPIVTAAPPHADRPAPAQPAHAPANDTPPDLDDALRHELEVTLDEKKLRADDALPESVEDEMSKLLGELSRTKR